MSSSKQENVAYLTQKLDSVIHAMTSQVFLANPADHVEFMMEYLRKNHGKPPGVNTNEKNELEFLRKEVADLKLKLASKQQNQVEYSTDQDSAQSSEESEDDDVVAELVQAKPQAARKPRASVSAEAFGTWNKKEDFKAPVYDKSDETKQALQARLEQAFMFSALNPEELEVVLGAMQQVCKKAGEAVITEGDDGDNLYVVEKGALSCTKVFVSVPLYFS